MTKTPPSGLARLAPLKPTPPLRIVIIDDQPAIQKALAALLKSEPDLQVVGFAGDGEEGLKVVHTLQPDAILLDLEMPRLDGFAFLRLLMAKRPTPVVVVSSHASPESVFRALDLGALEFVAKPVRRDGDLSAIRSDLLGKLRQVRTLGMQKLTQRTRAQQRARSNSAPPDDEAPQQLKTLQSAPGQLPGRLLCIGASTGGPPAILTILLGLDPRLPMSILITQHMPNQFTHAFAERLARSTTWPVREAAPGQQLARGEVLVASGDRSLCVGRSGDALRVIDPPLGESKQRGFVPSIDRMLESAAAAMGKATLAVILTGMSGDGIEGARAVHRAGGRVLAEAPQSAVVASMPEEAIRAGIVHEVAPLRRLADVITRQVLLK